MIETVNFIVWLLTNAIDVYILAIIVYALLSWFPGGLDSGLGRFLGSIVEPFEQLFSFAMVGMVSFAPIVAIVVLSFVQTGIRYLGNLLVGY